MIRQRVLWCGLALGLASGCVDDESGGPGPGGSSANADLPADAPACLVSGATLEIQGSGIDKVDLLFAIDDSSSMQEEQAALVEQFPLLLRLLTSGDLDGDGRREFPPVQSLHLGVVSSDMGAVNVSGIERCEGLGDDGLLQHTPNEQGQGCQDSYPPFLSYAAGVNEPADVATDLACIGALGTEGCGFEQPLEATLKALWPAIDPMPLDGRNRITFLGSSTGGALGHGDGQNAGFLRADPAQRSVLAVVVVTDDDDCSSLDTRHWTPANMVPANDPLAMQHLNLRCHFNPQQLYPLERYIKGFQALHPEAPNLVVFSAIAGVPPDLVEPADYRDVEWRDPAQREAFYSRILADPRMQETIDPNPTAAAPDLVASCSTARGRTYPPIRLVKVAQGFGANGSVHSLCQEDLSFAVEKIVESIAVQLAAPCLPQTLPRDENGLAACNVVWQLPPPGSAQPSTPTACDAPGFEFLRPIGGERAQTSERGGALCTVPQLPARASDGEGWYYDDFSESVASECTTPGGRVSFTPGAEPPAGVVVRLECLNERFVVDSRRPDQAANQAQPELGSACAMVLRDGRFLDGDEACAVRLNRASSAWPDAVDRSMFCHPELESCVLSCGEDSDCPDDWTCDANPDAIASAGRSLCAPPKCSVGAAAADGRRVGDPCLPDIVPENGFDGREAYLATGSPHCGGGVCLVYKLEGDPGDRCVPRPPNPMTSDRGKVCPFGQEIEQRVYCSCRCDAPEGLPECACPNGYSCVDAFDQGGPDLEGGYCVRDGTFAR